MTKLPARTVFKGILVVFSVLILFLLFFHFIREVILIFVGVVLSISMAPAVDFLHDHKVNRSISVILIYLSAIIIFAVFIFLVLPQLGQQVSAVTPQIQDFYKSFRTSIQNSSIPLIRPWVNNLPSDLNSVFSNPKPTGNSAMNSLSAHNKDRTDRFASSF